MTLDYVTVVTNERCLCPLNRHWFVAVRQTALHLNFDLVCHRVSWVGGYLCSWEPVTTLWRQMNQNVTPNYRECLTAMFVIDVSQFICICKRSDVPLVELSTRLPFIRRQITRKHDTQTGFCARLLCSQL